MSSWNIENCILEDKQTRDIVAHETLMAYWNGTFWDKMNNTAWRHNLLSDSTQSANGANDTIEQIRINYQPRHSMLYVGEVSIFYG